MNKISIVMMSTFSGEAYKATHLLPIIQELEARGQLESAYGIWNSQDKAVYSAKILSKLKRSRLVYFLFRGISFAARKVKKTSLYFCREKIFGICAAFFFKTDADTILLKPRPSFLVKYYKRRGKTVIVEASENHTRYTNERLVQECQKMNLKATSNYVNEKAIRDYETGISNADYLICLTEFSAQTYVERGFPRDRIRVTGLEVGTVLIPPRPLSEEEVTFVSVAHHNLLKGTHRLLKVWKDKKIKNKLLIIGALDYDMRRYVQELGDVENVEFTGGMQRKEIEKIYQSRKCVGIFLSLSESYGRSVYECLSTSTPVIVTPTCTCGLVENEKRGYVVSEYENEAIYEAVLKCIQMDAQKYYAMSSNVYETLCMHQGKFVQKYTDALQECAEGGKW